MGGTKRSAGFSGVLAAAAAVLAAGPALSQPAQGPTEARTIKVVYPFVAGASGDVLTRIVAEKLAAGLSVPTIVENRPGAAGRIGAKSVIAADPDGLTRLVASSPMIVIYPHSYPALDYDPDKDLAPVSQVATFDVALAVGPDMAARTISDLVTWIKANPAHASYGSPGAGGLGHFVAVMFATSAGLDARHVSYRGSGAVLNDLVGGQIPFSVLPLGDVTEQHSSGKIRALATAGPTRSPFLPSVPTFKESGIAIEGQGWYGLYAPARTPTATIERLYRVVAAALAAADVRDRLGKLSPEAKSSTPAALAALHKIESTRWGPVVRASGFKPEQ